LRVDFVAQILRGQRQVQRDGLPVFRNQGALEERDAAGLLPDGQGRLTGRRRFGHQPLEAHGAGSRLLDVVHRGRGDEVDLDDSGVRIRSADRGTAKATSELGQLVNSCKRGRVEDTVGVFLVDHTNDDHVVQAERLLHRVVEHPHGLVLKDGVS